MRYSLMGNSGRIINSVHNLQRSFNKQFRKHQLWDIWSQVFVPLTEPHKEFAVKQPQHHIHPMRSRTPNPYDYV